MDIFGNKLNKGGFTNPAIENLNMNTIYQIKNLSNGIDPTDAINLSQLTTYNPFNQSLNTTDTVGFNGLFTTDFIDMNNNKIKSVAPGELPTDAINLSQLISYVPPNPFDQSLNTTDNVQFNNVNMAGNWSIPNTQPASPTDTNFYVMSAQGGNITPNYTAEIVNANVRITYPRPTFPSDLTFYLTVPSGNPITYLDLAESFKQQFNNQVPAQFADDIRMESSEFVSILGGFRYRCNCVNLAYPLFGFTVNSFTMNGNTNPLSLANNLGIIIDSSNTYGGVVQSSSSINFETTVGWAISGGTEPITSGSPFTYSIPNQKWILTSPYSTPDLISSITFNNIQYAVNQGGFVKFFMSEDQSIGTSLWGPGGSGRIHLQTSGITLRHNSVNRYFITNAENYEFSANQLNYNYMSNTETSSIFNTFKRFKIDSADCELSSPDAFHNIKVDNNGISFSNTTASNTFSLSNLGIVYAFNNIAKMIMNASNFLISNGATNRLDINGSDSRIISANGLNLSFIGNTAITHNFANIERLKINSSSVSLTSNLTHVIVNNEFISVYVAGSSIMDSTLTYTYIHNKEQTSNIYLDSNKLTLSNGDYIIKLETDAIISSTTGTAFKANTTHTQIISPNGLQVVEVNNTGAQINFNSNSYTLPTTRGTSGQVISITGSNCNWVTPAAGANAGFSLFNPLDSTATVLSGSKAFWYIVMVPCNCIITGFKTLMASGGSDPFHVGIYRGKTTNSASTILDLLAPIVTVSGGGFYSAAFVLQSGRSNVYTTGEYITVMYHSQGSTNTFYNKVGPSDVNLAWTTLANYGNANPPANLGSVAVLGATPNRLAIEFY